MRWKRRRWLPLAALITFSLMGATACAAKIEGRAVGLCGAGLLAEKETGKTQWS